MRGFLARPGRDVTGTSGDLLVAPGPWGANLTRTCRVAGRNRTARLPQIPAVAVGTALSGSPTRRSHRAGLPHWAPTSGAGVEAHAGPGMRDADGREPSSSEAVHPFPGQAGALAATPQRPKPVPDRLLPKHFRRRSIAGHGVVSEVPTHHARQPSALLGDG